jgi:uncharacterized membrane protein
LTSQLPKEPAHPASTVRASPEPAKVTQPSSRFRWLAATVALLAYLGLSQYSASPANPHAKTIGAALAIGPVMLAIVALLWLSRWRFTAALVGLGGALVLYRIWPMVERNFEWLDLAQQCGIYGLVAVIFLRSLFAGRVPTCTLLAGQMYGTGTLTPAEIAYTRRATAAWGVFYLLLTLTILVLFFTIPIPAWYLFVNFIVWGLMVVAGFADHALRRRVLPRHKDGGLLTLLRRAFIG